MKCHEVLGESLALRGLRLGDPLAHFTRVNDVASVVKTGTARPADCVYLFMAGGSRMRSRPGLRQSPSAAQVDSNVLQAIRAQRF